MGVQQSHCVPAVQQAQPGVPRGACPKQRATLPGLAAHQAHQGPDHCTGMHSAAGLYRGSMGAYGCVYMCCVDVCWVGGGGVVVVVGGVCVCVCMCICLQQGMNGASATQALPPTPANMSGRAAAGAVSRASINSVVPFAARIIINAPPPRPLAEGLTTPWHSAVATAASAACPPSASTSRPICEQRLLSAATMPRRPIARLGRPRKSTCTEREGGGRLRACSLEEMNVQGTAISAFAVTRWRHGVAGTNTGMAAGVRAPVAMAVG